MSRRQQFQILGFIAAALLFMSIVLVATSFLVSLIFQAIDVQPSWLVGQIINALLGLILCFLILAVIGRVVGAKERTARAGVFMPIIEAMGRIAKGDFSVRIEGEFEDNAIMGELAKSVTSMAVELDQMEKMRQEFISNVSHEIQSPLTSIRGFAQALQNERLSAAERAHYLTIIETESTRLSRLADNLLKLASLEAEHVKFEPKPYRLDRQIRNLILLYEPQWTGKALDMDVTLDEVMLSADEDLMSQVWINLLHNAIKFTPQGGRVCVTLRRCDVGVEFRINDTGVGIATDDLAHVFECFYKADKARQRSIEGSGSGLGLSIAQRIVEMHGGSTRAESEVGVGTTFVVTLPDNPPTA